MKFTDLLDDLKIAYRAEGHEHCRPGWVQIDCPFCGLIGHFRMGYNLHAGYVNCWACGKHPLPAVVASLAQVSYGKAKDVLRGVENVRTALKEADVRGTLELPVAASLMALRAVHREYLVGRGFDPDEISRDWGVNGIGPVSGHKWRLFIPIVYRGEMVSWTTRSISDRADRRYRSAKASQEVLNHKHLLYGEDHCLHGVIVHEGPIDVWRTGAGAVATFGTDFTQAQVRRLARYAKRVVCFDNVPEAQLQANKLCDALSAFPGTTYNVRLDAKDAAEAHAGEIAELRSLIA